MKVTIKLMACVFITAAFVASASAYLAMRSDEAQFRQHANDEVDRIARGMEAELKQLLHGSGVEDVIRHLEQHQIRNYDLEVKWVLFDQPRDQRLRPHIDSRLLPELVRGRAVSIRQKEGSDERLCTYWRMDMGDRVGGLEFTRSADELHQRRKSTISRICWILAAIVALGGLVMWIAGIVFVGLPLQALTVKTRRIGQGDLQGPLELKSRDELGELATSINTMCKQLEASREELNRESADKVLAIEQLQHADRLRTVGRLASGIAHELGTPLNVVSGRAELIASGDLSPDEITTSARAIQHESRRMAELIQNLLDFARRRTPQKSMVDLNQLVTETSELLRTLARKRGVEIVVEPQVAPCFVSLDATQLQQVLTNLIMNSIQAMPEGGEVTVAISQQSGEARVQVADKGVGISEEHIGQLFEPFFTTKEPGEGTGLGLAIAHRIVEEHGGRIEVESALGTGTRFTIILPTPLEVTGNGRKKP